MINCKTCVIRSICIYIFLYVISNSVYGEDLESTEVRPYPQAWHDVILDLRVLALPSEEIRNLTNEGKVLVALSGEIARRRPDLLNQMSFGYTIQAADGIKISELLKSVMQLEPKLRDSISTLVLFRKRAVRRFGVFNWMLVDESDDGVIDPGDIVVFTYSGGF